MGAPIEQNNQAKLSVVREFTATGIIGITPYNVMLANKVQVVVENVGGGNTVVVSGRIRGQTAFTTLETIVGPSSGTSVDTSVIDEIQFNCTVYAASGGVPKLVASGFFDVASGGGGGGTVNSASNAGTGGVGVFDALVGDDLRFRNINAGSNKITVTYDAGNKEIDVDVDPANIQFGDLGGLGALFNSSVLGTDSTGDVISIPGYAVSATTGGLAQNLTIDIANTGVSNTVHQASTDLDPSVNSPNDTWTIRYDRANIDSQNDGFSLGTAVNAVYVHNLDINHQGSSDTGDLVFTNNYFNIGNGVDAIDVSGISYEFGFGNINANVNLSGPIQGYGFQPAINAAATFSTLGTYVNAFYDGATMPALTPVYQSFNASPTITSLKANSSYTGLNIGANIGSLQPSTSVAGINIYGNYGASSANTNIKGLSFGATATNARYAAGVQVSMDNISVYAGLVSSLVIQDLTLTFNNPGDNNSITVEYINDVLAGAEYATIAGNAIEVHIESGVSTATQVKAALDANAIILSNITTTISGTASDPQVTQAPTNFTGGESPGEKWAGDFDGNVRIDGSLSFTGALTIGALTAFAAQTVVSGSGSPASVHSLISGPTVPANATITNGDTMGVNTAALMSVGNNASFSSGPLGLGLTALGLPAVLTTGTGSTTDIVNATLYALSLDAGSTGGTVGEVNLSKAVAIPNGITTVTELRGFYMDLPFGDPGTTTWGIYIEPTTANNYFAKNVIVGSSPTPTNASVGMEINSTTKALLLSRMTTAERDALTAVDGMILYNTTLGKVQVREGGAWVSVI